VRRRRKIIAASSEPTLSQAVRARPRRIRAAAACVCGRGFAGVQPRKLARYLGRVVFDDLACAAL